MKILDGDQAGIYRITITRGDLDAWVYIGQASVLRKRRDKHLGALRKGQHVNKRMQRAFSKYGETSFRFDVLLVCARDKSVLDTQERLHLANEIQRAAERTVLNICLECPGSKLGVAMSDETKRKIGDGNRGKIRSAEHRKAVADATRNRAVSQETRNKRAASLMGNKNSVGVSPSIETREKIGAFFRGKKKPIEEIERRTIKWKETRKRTLERLKNGDTEGRG